jgi:Fic family protein
MNLSEKKAYVMENLKYLPEFEKKAFDFNFQCVLTKNSVGMESGHTAQLEDVVAVVKGHPTKLDEGLKRDIYNHYAAYLKMLDYLKQHPEGYLDEEIIKDVHSLLVKDVIDGGLYRNVNIQVKGSKYVPCDPIKVYHRMDKYIDQLNTMENDLDKVVYAHLQLSKIHPFLDGNGRLCRLILNYMLISEGYLPISIPAKRRNEYFATLEAFKVDKTSAPFKKLLEDLLSKEYDRLIELIEPHVK